MIKLNGSVEFAPMLNLADKKLIVSMGLLRKNNLTEHEQIAEITARLIGNKGFQIKSLMIDNLITI